MGLQYDVEIRYIESGNIGAKLGSVGSKIKDFNHDMWGLGRAISYGFSEALDVVGEVGKTIAGMAVVGVVGLGAMGAAVVNMNGKLEETQIALAAIFQANGASPSFGAGMGLAQTQMAKMRKDAADLPGEFTDLVNIFQTIAPNTFRGGLGADSTREMAAQTMAMAAIMRIPMHVAAREMSALIEGRAGSHNIMGLRMMGLAGSKATEFNHLSEAERIKRLQAEMSKYGDALGAYRHSFIGLFSTFKDNAKQLAVIGGKPLFESVKRQLESINGWFTENKPKIDAYANYIGQKLAHGFEYGVSWLKEYGPIVWDVASNAAVRIHEAWARMEPTIERIGSKIQSFFADPRAIDKLEHIAMLALGFKVAAPMVGEVGRWGLQTALGGSEGIGAAIAAPEVLVASAAVATLAAAAYGAKLALDDTSYAFHNQAFDMWALAKENTAAATKNIADSTSTTMTNLQSSMDPVLKNMGTVAIGAIDAWAWAMRQGSEHISFFVAQIPVVGTALSILAQNFDDAGNELKRHLREKDPGLLKRLDSEGGGDTLSDKTKVHNSVTHINKVEIIIQSDQDPSRIARMTVSELSKLQKNTKSGFIPKWIGGKS